MNNEEVKKRSRADIQVNIKGTHILDKELATFQFSVWDVAKREGHAKFVGTVLETAEYLEQHDLDSLEVSAMDLEYMHSLNPVSAVRWLIWYYETTLSKLEKNNFGNVVRVSYPTK